MNKIKFDEIIENIITVGMITGLIPFILCSILIGAVGVFLG